MNTMVFLYILTGFHVVDVKTMPDYDTCKAALAVIEVANKEHGELAENTQADCYVVAGINESAYSVTNTKKLEMLEVTRRLDELRKETEIKTEKHRLYLEQKDKSDD